MRYPESKEERTGKELPHTLVEELMNKNFVKSRCKIKNWMKL